ncbi:MAG: 4Fe-4S dicluster domain-containing protein [Dehalococcoidia bacterium]
MQVVGTEAMGKEDRYRKWQVSRRRLLKLMGAAGATAIAAPLMPTVLNKVSHSSSQAFGETDGNKSRRLRRWAMIIDLRRCDGCQSIDKPPQCTEACIEGHFVPRPMEWIEAYEHDLPGGGTQFLPTPCMQCQNPPCVNVCPVGATWSTPEGVVLIDQDRCIGCRMCMAACPYERRFFTWGKPPTPSAALFAEESPEHNIPMKKGVVYKCDFCPELARSGRLPFCAQACPNNAIYYGDMEEDIATNGKEIVRLSKFLDDNTVYRYKEDMGTKPRVYYISGHGQDAGRSPDKEGRKPTEWPWEETLMGAKTWKRSGR